MNKKPLAATVTDAYVKSKQNESSKIKLDIGIDERQLEKQLENEINRALQRIVNKFN